jgi:diguanylate cyclase (GGDEF)-like protein/PAS domain S-box-containing protein
LEICLNETRGLVEIVDCGGGIVDSMEIRDESRYDLAKVKILFKNKLFGVIITDESWIIKEVNQLSVEIMGFDERKEMIGLDSRTLFFTEEEHENFAKFYMGELLEGKVVKTDQKFKRRNGEMIWCTVSGQTIDDNVPPDLKRGIFWAIQDISESNEVKQKLVTVNNEMNAILDNSMTGIVLLTGGRIIKRVNKRMSQILGYDNDYFVGKSVEEFHLSKENHEEFGKLYFNSLINHSMDKIEYKLKRKDGTGVWVSISGKAIDQSTPPDLGKGVVWIVEDITRWKETEKQLECLAATDALTGICNRRGFLKIFERELAKSIRSRGSMSLLMMDIDLFKEVNDAYGHAIGDQVIISFANRCRKMLRISDVFARFGGDEFVILLPETTIKVAADIAERLSKTIASSGNGAIPRITASIGVVEASLEDDFDELIDKADRKMYEAKQNGRNRIAY